MTPSTASSTSGQPKTSSATDQMRFCWLSSKGPGASSSRPRVPMLLTLGSLSAGRSAVMVARLNGGPAALTAREALALGTIGGARVLGRDDEHEYLRFDMFDVNPHYHYEPPGHDERILVLDTVAEGDAVSWAIARLRDRLGPMLSEADGSALADAVDDLTLTRAVDEVESLARAR